MVQSTDDTHDFELALRAFALFTVREQERALKIFARLEYPSVRDRFLDAVHAVIVEASGESHNAVIDTAPVL